MLDDFVDRFVAGFRLARDCWRILRDAPSLLLLPLLSGFSCLLVILSFINPDRFDRESFLAGILRLTQLTDGKIENDSWKAWGTLFLFYLSMNFVIFFFNAALVHCCLFRIRGIPVNLFQGLVAATRRLPHLLAWSFVSASVGLIIRIAERGSRENEQYGRYLLLQVFGVAWSVATYFIVPVLVMERLGPVKALQRSVRVLTRTWGDQIGGHVGIGLFMFPVWLGGFGILWLAANAGISAPGAGPLLLVAAFCWFILAGLIQSTLETVLLSALYLYATQDEIPAQWAAARLEQAFYVHSQDT